MPATATAELAARFLARLHVAVVSMSATRPGRLSSFELFQRS